MASEEDDFSKPLLVLRTKTVETLGVFLNREKFFPAENGLQRDYRGLMDILDFDLRHREEIKGAKNKTSKFGFIFYHRMRHRMLYC